MNTMRKLALLLCLCALASLARAEDNAIASVNGVPIARHRLDAAIAQSVRDGAADTPSLRVALRDRLIAEELLWQKARGSTPVAAAEATAEQRARSIADYVARTMKPTTPDEQTVRSRYDEVVAALGAEEYRFSLIQTPDIESVRSAASEIRAGQDFAQVARRVSHAPSAARGGELGWVSFRQPAREGRTSGVPLAVARALAGMKPGQMSAPITLGDTWAIVRLDAVRPTLVPAYDKVKDDMRLALYRQSVEDATRSLVVDLLRGAHVQLPD